MGGEKGLDALDIEWNEGANAKINSKAIWDDLRAASAKDGVVAKSTGDIAKGLASGENSKLRSSCRFSPTQRWSR